MSAECALLRELDSERSYSEVSCLARSSLPVAHRSGTGGRALDVREVFGKIPRRPDPDKLPIDPVGALEPFRKSMNIIHPRKGITQLRHAKTGLFCGIEEHLLAPGNEARRLRNSG